MTSLIIVSLLVPLLAYCFFIVVALYGWNKDKISKRNNVSRFVSTDLSTNSNSINGVSVVIPFRDEAPNLRRLLLQPALSAKSDLSIEIILVDDHSEDNWQETVNDLIGSCTVLKNNGIGKKLAILTGVKAAKYPIILTTDADCSLPINWIKSMLHEKAYNDASMVFGGVRLQNDGSILGQFQSIDYSSMATVGAGFSSINHPFLCSGANLMFDKCEYLSVIDKIKLDYLSGDDVFLLHAFVDKKLTVSFARDIESIVNSKVQKSFTCLVNQRIRWGSKAVLYTNYTAIVVSVTVFLVNTTVAISVFYLLIDSNLIYFILLGYLLKVSIDIAFFLLTNRFWKIQYSAIGLMVTSLLYPFWILFIGMFGFISKGTWKGRA